MKNKLHITIIPHTHWDRAWYCTFQQFRARLIRLMDRLIRLLEGLPEYTTYMLDGQMLVFEDYLEVFKKWKISDRCVDSFHFTIDCHNI